MTKRFTPARYRALKWFADHEADPLLVLMREKPSTKMRRLMAREGQVFRVPVGQFNYQRWLLTPAGRELLERKTVRSSRHAEVAHV